MKFRTDFVTNSSSSSFVAILDIVLDNGEKKRFVAESSEGGEEGGWIVPPKKKDGELKEHLIMSLDKMRDWGFSANGEDYEFSEATLTLQCHTYGEYEYEANPGYMLETHLDPKWSEVCKEIASFEDEGEDEIILERMRKISYLDKYDDDSLLDLFWNISCEGADTEIIQKLHPDGSMEISMETGEDLFDVEDVSDILGYEDDDEDEEDWNEEEFEDE